jgi:hypothetical protein
MEVNQLNINGFVMEIARIPILKHACQEIEFPSISLPEVPQPNPLQVINQVGDHIIHDDFSFTFVVDEKMNNYMAIYHWMRGLAFPEKFEEFENFVNGITNDSNIKTFTNNKRINQFSDVTITILSNHKNPLFKYRLLDAFPISLSGFSASITDSDTVPITASCTMKFTGFEIEPA